MLADGNGSCQRGPGLPADLRQAKKRRVGRQVGFVGRHRYMALPRDAQNTMDEGLRDAEDSTGRTGERRMKNFLVGVAIVVGIPLWFPFFLLYWICFCIADMGKSFLEFREQQRHD